MAQGGAEATRNHAPRGRLLSRRGSPAEDGEVTVRRADVVVVAMVAALLFASLRSKWRALRTLSEASPRRNQAHHPERRESVPSQRKTALPSPETGHPAYLHARTPASCTAAGGGRLLRAVRLYPRHSPSPFRARS